MLKPIVYSFEKLAAWQEARKLSRKVYLLTQKFPSEEKFGMVSQMRRAATSVMRNLAEGSSRSSLKDQSRYSEIAYGSLMELLSDSIVSFDLDFLAEEDLISLRLDIDSISVKISGLKKSQLNRLSDNEKK